MKAVKLTTIFAISMAAAMTASAQTVFSGNGLSSLTYSYMYSGDAQYIPASGSVPALAALSTADSGTSDSADSPAVFVQGPLGLLSSFSASYDLYNSSGEAGVGAGQNPPYWIIWLADDPSYTSPIVADGGPTLDGSSLVHVGDLINGSITLAALDADTDPRTGLPYGQSTVAWAGVEIGDWDNGTNTIPAAASFDSITVVPEPSAALLVSMGLAGMLIVVRRRSA